MSELAEIAASVAKAFVCTKRKGVKTPFYMNEDSQRLEFDGSDLFDPVWQVRCRDWLLGRGYIVSFNIGLGAHLSFKDGYGDFRWYGPASEFAARAIHEIMK